MKSTILRLFIAALLLIVAVSCKKESVTSIVLEPSTLFIGGIGKTEILAAIILPENAANKKVSWESSNNNVATVHNGTITAISFGKTTITATTQDGNKTARSIVTVYDPSIEPKMVLVEGGTFIMGCNDGDDECYEQELPAHPVTLSSFKIAIYPITQKQWISLMGSNPSFYFGDDMPVHGVSWDDAQKFIRELRLTTGKAYRLPTEAEWEYAARGGNQSMRYKYSGSNNVDEVAWHRDNSNRKLHPVGTKKPNELGIYDMSGNAKEWCLDGWYRIYTNVPQTNPQYTIENIIPRIVRGGGAFYSTVTCRISAREGWHHEYVGGMGPVVSDIFSFRLVLSEP
ncbi:MAG: formylglycine-generating enzyme family protein [Bacteroidetes bacterium]|nr:formylglycine-generating enzyme family protein [Bacteroidota bacterium]MCL2303510.1 formylglycine-generating enzyme family protein [Lentimicrobiaceae bacterium]